MNYNDIKDIKMFEGIDEKEFRAMSMCIGYTVKKFQKNEIIILENMEIKDVGIIISGKVNMVKEDLWGNKTILSWLKHGDIMGETFIFGNKKNSSVTFLSASECEILFMRFDRIVNTCSNSCIFHRKLIENTIKMIADKNIRLMEKVEITSKKTLREKILAYLYIQSNKSSKSYFEIPLGRVELAEYLCADRSALTRELKSMKEENIIDYDKNTFKIIKSK